MHLEFMITELAISTNDTTNIQALREIFSHIIAFSLAITNTEQKNDIAFASPRVSEIYENMKYFFVNNQITITSLEEIYQIPVFPCLINNSLLCYNINEFLNSYSLITFMKNNNIKQMSFSQISKYIINHFNSPYYKSYFNNWTNEQKTILHFIIQYIFNNWTKDETNVISHDNYDFFFNDCRIIK